MTDTKLDTPAVIETAKIKATTDQIFVTLSITIELDEVAALKLIALASDALARGREALR